MSLIDKWAFQSRGGHGISESNYNLLRTTCCKSFLVEDDELLDYYIDPNNLEKVAQLLKGSSCPFCGSNDFSFEDIDDFTLMPNAWRWAAPPDLRNKI
jgi:hypothetical protein